MIRIPVGDIRKLIADMGDDDVLQIFERGFEEREVLEIWNGNNALCVELAPSEN